MKVWLGTTVGGYVGLMLLFAFATFLAGQAAAREWRGPWHAVGYALLLALAARFLVYALLDGRLLSATGFVTDLALLVAIALVAHRLTYVRRMLSQYPWLYERAGLFGYRERDAIGGGRRDT